MLWANLTALFIHQFEEYRTGFRRTPTRLLSSTPQDGWHISWQPTMDWTVGLILGFVLSTGLVALIRLLKDEETVYVFSKWSLKQEGR